MEGPGRGTSPRDREEIKRLQEASPQASLGSRASAKSLGMLLLVVLSPRRLAVDRDPNPQPSMPGGLFQTDRGTLSHRARVPDFPPS